MVLGEQLTTTRNGDILRISCHEPPLSHALCRAIDALNPVREPWRTPWLLRTTGQLTGECRDRFVLGEVAGELAAIMWYTVGGDFATFGAVFTAERFRRCGISSRLLGFTVARLDHEPGLLVTYLGVSKPLPRAMYARAGWHPYNAAVNTCIMRRFPRGQPPWAFDAEYFQPAPPCRVRPGRRGDLPALEALYNLMLPTAWLGRNRLHGVARDVAVECQIDAMLNEADTGRAGVLVLEDARCRLLGVAFARAAGDPAAKASAQLDFFVAPAALTVAPALLAAALADPVLADSARVEAVEADGDREKIALLRDAGFVPVTVTPAHFLHRGMPYDRIELRREGRARQP